MSTPRVALVSGGARGIGSGVCTRLAQDGWRVALCYRSSEAAASQTLEAITAAGGEGHAARCDVSDALACERLVGGVLERWGRLDALVNAAGPYERVPVLESTREHWDAMLGNNLHPVLHLAQLVAEPMRAQGWGRIVSFSMAGAERLRAQPELAAYYIAKVGVLVLTRTLAKVLAPHGITVNALSPGYVDTGGGPDGELERVQGRIPAGYVGEPDDVVAVVRFLLSDEARYVNGANIEVSGAWGI